LKIFISFLQSKIHHKISAYSFWQYYIKNGIEEAEDQWVECEDVDWAFGLVPQSAESLATWKTESWEKTVAYLKENKVDLFLSYLYPHQIDKNAIQEIQKMGIFCVNFYCDNIRNFRNPPKEFNVFDLNWVPEFKALKMYQKAKFETIHLPMPMWVEPKYRTPALKESDKVSFIGSKDIQRQLFFEALVKDFPSTEIDIYGAGWLDHQSANTQFNHSFIQKINNQFTFIKKFGSKAFLNKMKDKGSLPPISKELTSLIKNKPSFEEYIKISRESLITIGINRYPTFQYPMHQPDTYSRLRDIEAPMLGACYLTEYTEGLDELYDLGQEIETYKDISELHEKINSLKSDLKTREKLRLKGQKAALSKHSIAASLKKINEKMK
jgi:hypothetical protein